VGRERPGILVLERSPQLADRIREAIADLEPVPGMVVRDGLSGFELSSLAGAQVLVVGPSVLTLRGLHYLAELHRKAPSTAVVIVMDQRPEGSLQEILQVGADDILPLDVDSDELTLALERVLTIARRRWGNGPSGLVDPPAARVTTVGSPTEGCGKTFLAANTALFLAQRTGGRVVLVDLDLQFGEVRTALRVKSEYSIVDALRAEAEGHDLETVLPELLAQTERGFSVLAGPRDPAEADSVTPADVARVIRALRHLADHVVVDAPSGLAPHLLPALELTDHLLAVATPDRPSVHNLRTFLGALEQLGISVPEVSLVLNKAQDYDDLSEAAAQLPLNLRAVLPYDRDVARSVNFGVPLLDGTPDSPASRKLLALLESIDFSAPIADLEGDGDPTELVLPTHDLPRSPACAGDRRRTGHGPRVRSTRPRHRPPVGRPATRRRSPARLGERRERAPPPSRRARSARRGGPPGVQATQPERRRSDRDAGGEGPAPFARSAPTGPH
jgi:pilus assembly protein CpaE